MGIYMVNDTAMERAKLTKTAVIDTRTLENSHKRLAELLKPGMTVLDVGCGTGAITSGIAELVGPNARVVGVDNNPILIEKARQTYKDLPGLSFEIADIYNLPFYGEFDIVTSARVLQWLSKPKDALNQMIQSTKENGRVLVLDYNHTKISWEPEIPETMKSFYKAFLQWRSDAGMDNEIADHLQHIFKDAGLTNIKITQQNENTKQDDHDFHDHITIWANVAQIKGKQMMEDGAITEDKLEQSQRDFSEWIKGCAKSQTMYLLAIEGTVNRELN
ncbi:MULTISPECIES: methyltransferase domain-containing protein [Priestia]|nr:MULTISPECIES: methyltransferase domain-containing protein [Priestia]